MRNHEFEDDGTLREITRVEFAPLGGGLFQWSLWSHDVLIEQQTSRDLQQYLDCTAILLRDEDERIDPEECEFPLGLD